MKPISAIALFVFVISVVADWPQGGGPSGDFQIVENHPTEWSVALDQNITWKLTLPETGQSTPIVSNGRVFFSTMKQVQEDTRLGSDIVAWCMDAKSGNVLWKRPIPGPYPLRISGAFSDSSSPPAVCDGERVVFTNASGTIVCFNLKGKTLWKRDLLTVGRSIPFLHDGKFIYTAHSYPPEEGKFPHTHKDEPFQKWTQLQVLDMETGEEVWTTSCGLNMGCAILPISLSDGRSVTLVGRGGGHSPPERPEGVSLVNLKTGTTMWTLPLEGYMSTQTNLIRNNKVYIFHKTSHLTVNALTGQIEKEVSIVDDIPTRKRSGDDWTSIQVTLESRKGRMITQGSNLLVGNYHYYRSYTSPYLGRVNVDTGAVEHLELPLQVSRIPGEEDRFQWHIPALSKTDPEMRLQAFAENDMINSRGHIVFDDARSKGNGWGHIAAPTMSVAGDYLYIPVMSGTVYVIRHDVDELNENAIKAVNDLGPVGKSWTRASLSFSNGKVFAHTIRELIAIGN
ncbi:PQQ-binding-like beta-propeller repeat protein [Opitutales bacterium]|nr:PQQ-binding-like beta-propeller repeat protein [Opitutales bacterium]